ncbi:hypothetical protein [Nitrosarchaeum sp.]|uniref:hypothetical protein n=1 Tax=Nitrosarchaeum sp. TaxID=2026886 RepID=UPI002605D029|nr:hypothetical protein [Nitrosarchaeum sp.]
MNSVKPLFFSLIFVVFFIPLIIPNSFADSGVVAIESIDVIYNIEHGNIESIFLDPDFFELIITMNTQDDGTIEITIPREILDATFESTDDMFFVLVDGFETSYIESKSTSTSRTLMIPFFNGDSIVEIIGTHALNPFVFETEIIIPNWIKNNAGWWADGLIKDADFVLGIQYLINEEIMTIPQTQSGQSSQQPIPNWIKNNAGWWADGLIEDAEFVSGLQYLITNGIIHV